MRPSGTGARAIQVGAQHNTQTENRNKAWILRAVIVLLKPDFGVCSKRRIGRHCHQRIGLRIKFSCTSLGISDEVKMTLICNTASQGLDHLEKNWNINNPSKANILS